MSQEDRREHLRQRTTETAALVRRAAQKLEARRSEPLEPGDLVLSPRTEDLPIEWLVLEKIETHPVQLIVAPVDTMALYGPTDVQLSRADTGGPVVARCGYPVRIAAELLSSRDRTGRVDAESLERLQSRCREPDRLAGMPTADELGSQPDYQDWIADVVQPACDRLLYPRPELRA